MNVNKLNILFFLKKVKINKKSECPIMCRLTFAKDRREFSTGIFINPELWDSKAQMAKPPTDSNTFKNNELSLVKNKLNQAFLFLQVNAPVFDVNDVYRQYSGVPIQKEMNVIETFEEYLARIFKLIGKDIKLVTYNKYQESKRHLADYIKWKLQAKDVKLKSLKASFITDYEYYLKTEKNFQIGTIYKAIQRFRKVVKYAVGHNYLDKDPFMLYKTLRPRAIVVYLTNQELKDLEEYDFAQSRLGYVRDMFVFCCYTGLAFNEMSKLEHSNIVTGFDEYKWIQIIREKTNRQVSIPLLPAAIILLNKLAPLAAEENEVYVLPRISNQKFNSYLKEIAVVVGIKKKLCHHMARKTFATTILLYNDVPMEIVSELLGHSKMSITQEHYGKIVQKKVSDHMQVLSQKIRGSA